METKKENHKPEPAKVHAPEPVHPQKSETFRPHTPEPPKPEHVAHAAVSPAPVHAAVAPAPVPAPAPVKPKIDSSAEAMDAKREEIARSEKTTKRLHAELDAMIGARRHA